MNPKDDQDAENGHHFSIEYLQINAQEIQPYQGSDTSFESKIIIERPKQITPRRIFLQYHTSRTCHFVKFVMLRWFLGTMPIGAVSRAVQELRTDLKKDHAYLSSLITSSRKKRNKWFFIVDPFHTRVKSELSTAFWNDIPLVIQRTILGSYFALTTNNFTVRGKKTALTSYLDYISFLRPKASGNYFYHPTVQVLIFILATNQHRNFKQCETDYNWKGKQKVEKMKFWFSLPIPFRPELSLICRSPALKMICSFE